MKICHQVNSLNIGGVETFVYRLCKFSNEDVIVYSHEDGPIRKWLEDIGIKVFLKNEYTMENLIESEAIDIVVMHTGSYYPDYAIPLAKKYDMKVKWIAVMHTICPGEPWVDAIISISQAIAKAQVKETCIIYPGIERNPILKIGEITRLAPYKYLEDLIEVAKRINEKCQVTFEIIGHDAKDHPGYSEYLKKLVWEKGLEQIVKFKGWQDQINYKDWDAFIHLVGDEAYPVTILEALNNNLPVITYSKIGTKEISLQYPDNMNLCENINQVIDALEKIILSRPKHIANTAEQFSEVYEKVIKLE